MNEDQNTAHDKASGAELTTEENAPGSVSSSADDEPIVMPLTEGMEPCDKAQSAAAEGAAQKSSSKPKRKIPLGILIAICALPAASTVLFYILRLNQEVMAWFSVSISAPIRRFMAMLTSVFPFSIVELLITAGIIWLIIHIIKTIIATVHSGRKLRVLSKRLLVVAVLALYFWSGFCWLWNSGYHAPGFGERNGFHREGVAVEELLATAAFFAEKANELAPLVSRDAEGSFDENRSALFSDSTGIYHNIAAEFPCLGGKLYRPKPMLFSWVMSRTGYTGMYFALTGEANINNMMPGAGLPATLAHEHAHHLGVFAEDEASFIGILACVKSDDVVFAYSGYLAGLNYLLRAMSVAIARADSELLFDLSGEIRSAQSEILDSLVFEVRRDRWDSYEFWQSQRTVNTGITIIDSALTAVTETVSDAVDAVYDSFLKSQNQELGLQSYGACVDLLVEYFAPIIP